MRLLFAFLGALLMATAVQAADYLIKPGDRLRIEVLEDSGLNRDALVLPDGRISVPLAGSVQAGGRTVDQVSADISGRLASNFAAAPTVYVGVSALADAPRRAGSGVSAKISVYVLGEIRKPGEISVKRGTNVLQLLAMTGGFTDFAATKRIQLRRTDAAGNESIQTINYRALEGGASVKALGTLADGDVIIVPQRRLFE